MERYTLNMRRIRTTLARIGCLSFALLFSIRMLGAGFIPTDAGLVINFEEGDQFLLSVWIDLDGDSIEDAGEEFFVCHYNNYTGGHFNYASGNSLKLIPQALDATEPTLASVWTIDSKLTHTSNVPAGETSGFRLDGICYTMWSSAFTGNTSRTLTTSNNDWAFLGALDNNMSSNRLCDVAFTVPTVRALTNHDPNGTLEASHIAEGRKRGSGTSISPSWAFDGQMKSGFLGMNYREVYMYAIPRNNGPISYANAALVTFNTSDTVQNWSLNKGKYDFTLQPGTAGYIFADDKHKPTQRTLFRIYVLNKPFASCGGSYFFGWDTQSYVRYRDNKTGSAAHYTSYRKIYTLDHYHCMDQVMLTNPYAPASLYQTEQMNLPTRDSVYFYVGYNNEFYAVSTPEKRLGNSTAVSAFKPLDSLRIRALRDKPTAYVPAATAYGRIAIDANSDKTNLGASFEPAGYFLKVSTGTNVQMVPSADRLTWTTEEMWTITPEWAALNIKATTFTGAEFSASDPGADIAGWSQMVSGTSIHVKDSDESVSVIGKSGWARIYADSAAINGGMEFILADPTRTLHYDNNIFVGQQIPDQHPISGSTKVKVQDARLYPAYTFLGWATSPDGPVVYFPRDSIGKEHYIGDSIDLAVGTTTLYAVGTYLGAYYLAFSFMQDGKRYYITHPNSSAPRFARARHFDDWTNVYQGMSDAENTEPNYISTYKALGNPGACLLCEDGEYVLDPRREMVHGVVDSLMFYEHFSPPSDEYLGLYYNTPNTLIGNNTWAGIFKSTNGWPTFIKSAVDSTKLYSTQYFGGMTDYHTIIREDRVNASEPYIQYDPVNNQFNGIASEVDATTFQITAVGVADEHHVLLPDTTVAWQDTITFDYHDETQSTEQIWSKLIGKQLMMLMMVGPDTTYFHPNDAKTITTANELRISNDYRLTQTITYIRDSRVESLGTVAADDKPILSTTSDEFHRTLTSGMSSPMDVQYQGNYIDMIDTIRVRLTPARASQIQEYYGRWKRGAEGLHIDADGSRYRDIIVRTKTYHYSPTTTRLVLTPARESYNFSPLNDQSMQLDFTLAKVTSRQLLDVDGNVISEETLTTEDVTGQLALGPGACSFASGGTTYFRVDNANTVGDHVTLITQLYNISATNYDTLLISMSATVNAVTYPVTARVPLSQPPLVDNNLIWSAVDEASGKRYYIMAGSGGLIYRQYTVNKSILYKNGTTNVKLVIGTADAANSDEKYLTQWQYKYPDYATHPEQLTLSMEDVDKSFYLDGDHGAVSSSGDTAVLSYYYAAINTNDNGNYEELVRLKYGPDKWLKFSAADGITLQDDSASATIFSWAYLFREYSLMNNGTYPTATSLTFAQNRIAKNVTHRYKAYREYSMLINNTMTYLCREEESNVSNLTNKDRDWKTSYSVTLLHDQRPFDEPYECGITKSTNSNLTTTVNVPAGWGPAVTIDGKYVDVVDTLDFQISLQEGAPEYRFKDKWSSYTSLEDAHLKIPLIYKTYHTVNFDSLQCTVEDDKRYYTFPASLAGIADSTTTFMLHVTRREGEHTLDVDNNTIASELEDTEDLTGLLNLANKDYAEIRLVDELGNVPTWCTISDTTANSITIKCLSSGIRAPRKANILMAMVMVVEGQLKYINYRLTVSQPSLFDYGNNQHLVHSQGASGDPLKNGMQQVHENKRILYYYPDQDLELPIRERGYHGWWRWYREGVDEYGNDVGDTDAPDSLWRIPPQNSYKGKSYPYRVIGDSVWVNPADHSQGKRLVTMGRATVFWHPAKFYNDKNNPPANSPRVAPPINKKTLTYAAELSNYYDNLPLSVSQVNQIDTAALFNDSVITEPTLSLREIFELHPWTEMAEKMEGYKDTIASATRNLRYMEDHVILAPTGNPLLLRTEQRYIKANLVNYNHSESLLGYYMRDDHWSDGGWDEERQDTMIWCGGWDADCQWYKYDPHAAAGEEYSTFKNSITERDDFLKVGAKGNITGTSTDTVYYCLRARSKSTTGVPGVNETTEDGAYWFNICRYKIIYHDPNQYGPKLETAGVALKTDEEIEHNYEVLERLNFDYNTPGEGYHVYPHPLPWADASYGYCYPVTDELPDNRHHNDFAPNFAGVGEYGLINKIPVDKYWYTMEQHGGADNGYMIYCDGMSSAGQVAALSLKTQLCDGQKMYFSAYVGNPSNQKNKSCPNFTFSVQGSTDGDVWEDISSYMTGDIQPSRQWYQILFPIEFDRKNNYEHFRVRIYNVASDFDGNDFTIDDMCLFATKPPLMAYQANTTCAEHGENDSLTHVILRIDYQGFEDKSLNGSNLYYTVKKVSSENDTSFIHLEDSYFNEDTLHGIASKPDTIYGQIRMPASDHVPASADSVFDNISELIERFDETLNTTVFRQGYVTEEVEGAPRPIMYIIHSAKVTPDNSYTVHMATAPKELLDSKCGMTGPLNIRSRMVLKLNEEEKVGKEILGLCPNTTYDISLRVKGTLYLDNLSPIALDGSCKNDWLLYGDTAEASSLTRYGYRYSDIVKVVSKILRADGVNTNRTAHNLTAVSRAEMERVQAAQSVSLTTGDQAYDVLKNLVEKGFLTLYQSDLTASLKADDSLQYVALPIVGTGYDDEQKQEVEVCPLPVLIKVKSAGEDVAPLMVGGIKRDSTEAALPIVVLLDEQTANHEITLRVDSIAAVLDSIVLFSTNDPNYLEGIHSLSLTPDRSYDFGGDNSGYYKKGEDMILRPASGSYHMCAGYDYTFVIVMQTNAGSPTNAGGCRVGSVPFTVSIVPEYMRWAPKSMENAMWNNPDNWIGITSSNQPIHEDAHFVPLGSSSIIITPLAEGLPYPVLPDPASLDSKDSVKQVNFTYNTCDKIRFMPGTALGQQQLLNYTIAVVDMSMPQNTWALRAAPVTGMISGDVFMSSVDLSNGNTPWEVGEFDLNGRSATTGNGSFWLSLYNRSTTHLGNGDVATENRTAAAEWSKVTNAMTLSLPPAQGFAIYSRTKSGSNAVSRLPKNDDIYYYYTKDGDKDYDKYEQNLRALRDELAGGSGKAGKLAFHPDGNSQGYTLTNGVASTSFVFGNPTMGYIDIWGFIADNPGLTATIDYMTTGGVYTTISQSAAEATSDIISNQARYLPPMHAMVLTAAEGTSLNVTLNANRIVTSPAQVVRGGSPAPKRSTGGLSKGIMTVTATNAASSRCKTRLLLGQGYHRAIREGEDAMLTTVNIDHYTNTSAPATPFNLYALDGGYGLSIDLRDSLLNVPISFYMSDLPFAEKTQLWFTGVNNIDGQLVLYDAQTDTERAIRDGICLDIETPAESHQLRYYIRRRGYTPAEGNDPIATGVEHYETDGEQAVKFIHNGQVFILRNGHIYTAIGQKVK